MSDELMAQVASQQGRLATEQHGDVNLLLCPSCGSTGVHVDTVVFRDAAAHEMYVDLCSTGDEAHMHINVDAFFVPVTVPVSEHTVGLVTRCDGCQRFGILSLTAHEGHTFTELRLYDKAGADTYSD